MTTFYAMLGQYGTPIDPPAPFDPMGTTMDQLPHHALAVDDIRAWERCMGGFPQEPSPHCAPICPRTGEAMRNASGVTCSPPGFGRRSARWSWWAGRSWRTASGSGAGLSHFS